MINGMWQPPIIGLPRGPSQFNKTDSSEFTRVHPGGAGTFNYSNTGASVSVSFPSSVSLITARVTWKTENFTITDPGYWVATAKLQINGRIIDTVAMKDSDMLYGQPRLFFVANNQGPIDLLPSDSVQVIIDSAVTRNSETSVTFLVSLALQGNYTI